MKNTVRVLLASGVLASAMLATSASALTLQSPSCTASTVTRFQAGYVSCLGSFVGNMDNQLTGATGIYAAIGSGFGLSTQNYFSSEGFGATGNPFAQNEGALDDGVINFDRAQTGSFVLGLKQANGFGLYLFNGSSVLGGITRIAYDTNGVKRNGGIGLSHAGFFGTPTTVSPVPEPESYALLLAGLALMGRIVRTRKKHAASV